MTIEQDVDFNLGKKHSKKEKGRYAYHILGRFDQVKDELSKYPDIYPNPENDEIMRFLTSEYIPPTARLVIKHYRDNDITRNEALRIINGLRKKALEYFLLKGCDPSIAEQEEKRREIRIIKACKKELEKALEDAKLALKEMGMTDNEIERLIKK